VETATLSTRAMEVKEITLNSYNYTSEIKHI